MPRVTRSACESPCDWSEMMAHDLAEAALEIADSPVPLVKGKMDPAAVEAMRLQVELCKVLAAKLLPRVYGDRVAAEVNGGPVPIGLSVMDWEAVIAQVTGNPGTPGRRRRPLGTRARTRPSEKRRPAG